MPFIHKKYYPTRSMVFFAGEGCLTFAAISAIYIVFAGWGNYVADPMYPTRAFVVMVIFQLSLYFFDLYDFSAAVSVFDQISRGTRALGAGCMALGFLYYCYPWMVISNWIFWTGCCAICCSVAFWRSLYVVALRRRIFAQHVLILGTGKLAWSIAREIESRFDCGYKIVAYLGRRTAKFAQVDGPFYDGDLGLVAICRRHRVEKIVVALDDRRGATPIEGLIDCRLQGVLVAKGIRFYEELTSKILVETVNAEWIIYPDGINIDRLSRFNKRLGDIFLAISGLLLFSPFMVLAAVAILMESPGTVFYQQERVGVRGEPFVIYKFRSMRTDAEKDGAIWARANDDRVTRLGRIMRKARLDELPQLWNVLKGEMSIVGPRPERPIFVNKLSQSLPYYSLRHKVKPGITGWAQVCYPYGATEQDSLRKLEYDLYYLKNISCSFDLWIIFQTVKTVLWQKGAR